jgi:histidine triad (HIT) family protein
MTNCIFCQIAAKKVPSQIQYEDRDIIAFDDIHPKAPVHILIVPKKHLESVMTLEKEDIQLIGKLIYTAKNIAAKKGLKGYKLIFNVGREGGQLVDHLHLHLLGGQNLKSIV